MTIKFHEKNQAVYLGLQTVQGSTGKLGTGTFTLSGVAITGTAGQFSCTASSSPLYVGQELVISGTSSGTGTITGYTNPTTYYIKSTNGSTTFVLTATRGGTAVTTTAGTTTGLTFTANSLTSSETIAATEIAADPTRETGSFAYLGDSLSREEFTYEKDKYIDLNITTYQQVVATNSPLLDPDSNSIWKAFQLCGGNVVVNQAAGTVFVDNAIESADYGTADVRLSTPDDPTYDKLYKFWDLRGTVDVSASVGELLGLKFALKGNADDPVAIAKQVANNGNQVIRVAPSVLPSTIKKAKIIDKTVNPSYSSAGTVSSVAYVGAQVILTFSAAHNITADLIRLRVAGATPAALNGDFVGYVISTTEVMYYAKGNTGSGTATGTITAQKGDTAETTFCFNTLNAPNFFGFDFQRFTTGCEQGFSKGAVPTDVTVSMLEAQVGAAGIFNPDINIGSFFSVLLQVGKGTTLNNVGYMWDNLQLATTKQGKIGAYLARDVTFRNTGSSFIFYQ